MLCTSLKTQDAQRGKVIEQMISRGLRCTVTPTFKSIHENNRLNAEIQLKNKPKKTFSSATISIIFSHRFFKCPYPSISASTYHPFLYCLGKKTVHCLFCFATNKDVNILYILEAP
ncbi:hypothetical protein GOODEAATRI_005512 [Goodea atripinnis]|uniref:Uncharacterized protein n=1 Tax=Goodea atripinnis TaxID=208336 RepID=A0ABV0N868_9TELE